jgi:hypothetical protein
MDTGNLRDKIASASTGELEKILAYLQAEQAERDQDRAERERKQAERDEERAEREREQARSHRVQVAASVATVLALLLSGFALVVSIFTVRQGTDNLKQQREAQTSQEKAAIRQDQESRYSSLYGLYQDLEKTIADHPRLISCFYGTNCDANLTTQEMDQARLLASYVADFYAYLYSELQTLSSVEHLNVPDTGEFVLRKDNNPAADEGWVTWSETIVDAFKGSTLTCKALTDSADAYEKRFRHALAVRHVCPGLKDPGYIEG